MKFFSVRAILPEPLISSVFYLFKVKNVSRDSKISRQQTWPSRYICDYVKTTTGTRGERYINHHRILTIIIFFGLITPLHASAIELITDFTSRMTVRENGEIDVNETITVQADGYKIKRGIYREFPTQYRDRWGNAYNVNFNLKEVLMDGSPTPYLLKKFKNGVRLYIGDENCFVSRGFHTYTIRYITNRQLGFFKNHDELFWNVTGNGWRFPILKAQAFVTMPSSIPTEKIEHEAYTGYLDGLGKYYISRILPNGTVEFSTTRMLAPQEGISIVVSWPKGYIAPPSALQTLGWFFKDNLYALIAFLLILSVLSLYLIFWVRRRRHKKEYTVIPLFYPPDKLNAGDCRYLQKQNYDNLAFASDLVELATNGYLTIKHKTSFFSNDYELIKTPQAETLPKNELVDTLFAHGDTVTINKMPATMARAYELAKSNAERSLSKYFDFQTDVFVAGAILSAICLLIVSYDNRGLAPFVMIATIAINWIGSRMLSYYTDAGDKLKADIEGFKLFLGTTETERLKIIGTPPTKTPELYEKYLPYAMALGVEEAWSKQFAPIFKNLEAQGHTYQPMWYIGTRPFTTFQTNFASNVSKSISSAISSSVSAPGTFSGRGGGGGSGRGGGGGGGGGW